MITVQTDIWVLLCTCCINNLSKATGKGKSILCIFSHINLSAAEKKITHFCICHTWHIPGFLWARKIKQAFAGFNQPNPALLDSDFAFDKTWNKTWTNSEQSQAAWHWYTEPFVTDPVVLAEGWSPLAVNGPLNISWFWISDVSQDRFYHYRSYKRAWQLLNKGYHAE